LKLNLLDPEGGSPLARLTRHEILKEDKFLVTVEKVRDYYLKHQKQILVGASIVVGVTLLVTGGIYFFAHQSQQAKDELSQALRIYHAPVTSAGVPEAPPSANEPSFKSAKEKYEKALAEFQKIGSRYSSHPVGKIARYYTGLSLLGLDRSQEAISALEPLSKEKSDYGALARLALAEVYESKGDLNKAAETYKQIVESNSVVTPRDVNMMHLAQLYESQNKAGEATKIYQQVVKDFPGTQFSTDAERKLKQASQ
jgi:tetratricopeptide (TPR) repeat protein